MYKFISIIYYGFASIFEYCNKYPIIYLIFFTLLSIFVLMPLTECLGDWCEYIANDKIFRGSRCKTLKEYRIYKKAIIREDKKR